jgi:DHA1 family inner membrane transport protein
VPQRRWAVYLSGGFGLSISAMLSLLVPLRAHELGLSIGAIGVIVAARSISETLLAMPLGLVTSRVGTRTAFMWGTGGCALGCVAFTVATNQWTLVALNAVVGGARAMAWVASQAYVSGSGPVEERTRDTGRFSFVSNASQMVAPLLVGAVAAFAGYRWTFLLLGVHCLAFAVLGLALPRSRQGDLAERVRPSAIAALFRLPRLQVAMILSFVRLAVPSVWTPFFPLLLVAAGFTAGMAGAVLSFAAVVATAVNLLTGRLSRWASPEVLCIVALGSAAVGLLISPHLMSIPAVFLPAALVGVGNGLSLPLLIVLCTEAAPPGQAAVALGARNSVNSFAAAVAPLGVAPLVASYGTAFGLAVMSGATGVLLAAAYALHLRAGRIRGRGLPAPAATRPADEAPRRPTAEFG